MGREREREGDAARGVAGRHDCGGEAARGWAGAAVWGSQPAVDARRGLVFVGTGNAYSASAAAVRCQLGQGGVPYALNNDSCVPEGVLQDAILAIELHSGAIRWVP